MNGLFNRRRLQALAAIAGLSLLLSMYLMVRGDPKASIDSVQADTFSVSALGHAAFVGLLEASGREVLIDRVPGAVWDPTDSLVIAAEPTLKEDGTFSGHFRRVVRQSERLIVVLPKRLAIDDETVHSPTDHVSATALVAESDVDGVLEALGLIGVIRRLDDGTPTPSFGGSLLGTRALAITGLQYIECDDVEPLISDGERVLVARVRRGVIESHQHVVLVSDPDLLNNHGLHRADHAAVILDLIDMLAPDDERIVFEETIHDHEFTRSLFDHLTTFPLSLAFLQGLLAIAVAIWAGSARFGPPLPAPPRLGTGRRTLLDNTAELLVYGGYSTRVLTSYLNRTVDQVARAYHAPLDASRTERFEAARSASLARGCHERPDRLADETRSLNLLRGRRLDRARRTLIIAVRIHRWKQEVLHGPATDHHHS